MTSVTCPNCGKEAVKILSAGEVDALTTAGVAQVTEDLHNAQAALALAQKEVEDLKAELADSVKPIISDAAIAAFKAETTQAQSTPIPALEVAPVTAPAIEPTPTA